MGKLPLYVTSNKIDRTSLHIWKAVSLSSHSGTSLDFLTVEIIGGEKALLVIYYSPSFINNNIVYSYHLLRSCVPDSVLLMEKEIAK